MLTNQNGRINKGLRNSGPIKPDLYAKSGNIRFVCAAVKRSWNFDKVSI